MIDHVLGFAGYRLHHGANIPGISRTYYIHLVGGEIQYQELPNTEDYPGCKYVEHCMLMGTVVFICAVLLARAKFLSSACWVFPSFGSSSQLRKMVAIRNPFKSTDAEPVIGTATEINYVEPDKNGGSSTEEKHPSDMGLADTVAELEKIRLAHQFDPNLPQDEADMVDKALRDGDVGEIAAATELFSENSPYEEVRAAVRNTDDGSVANTVRAWILGMFFVTIGSGLNMFLSMR
jgi:hypothetical protein